MSQVTVTINKRTYDIACDDGQEAHLRRLAAYVDNRVGELIAAVGQVGDARLLVMASLLIADELSDSYSELDQLRKNNDGVARRIQAEETIADGLEKMAERIESIAVRLEEA